MSIIKSFSVGDGDMFYIKHNSENFTIIDCNLEEHNKKKIVNEICAEGGGKEIMRFISTHPDEDHFHGIEYLDKSFTIVNFYCVSNNAIKTDESESFDYYCKLRDKENTFFLYRGCSRKWMNEEDEKRGSSGINILWPILENDDFKKALSTANNGGKPNNISPIIKYSLENGATVLWFGDLEADFMEKIQDAITLPQADIVFAPHHGRSSGKLPAKWLKQMSPQIIVIGEADSSMLDYYRGYNTITQNSAKDIVFECVYKKVHVYVSNPNYSVLFLGNEYKSDRISEYYKGSFNTKEK